MNESFILITHDDQSLMLDSVLGYFIYVIMGSIELIADT